MIMLTGTRNMIAMIFLSGFLFTNWNKCAEIYTSSNTTIDSDIFKYGLIYYSSGAVDNLSESHNPIGSKSYRQYFDRKFIVKTRRSGNRFYHHFYNNPVREVNVVNMTVYAPPFNLINPGNIILPYTPYMIP